MFLKSLLHIVEECSLCYGVAFATTVFAMRLIGALPVCCAIAFHLAVIAKNLATLHLVAYRIDTAPNLTGYAPIRLLVAETRLDNDSFLKS
ncbi:unknown [Dialister sp. CAG:357]|nr:unknown [Dialister sp. CAG:357]